MKNIQYEELDPYLQVALDMALRALKNAYNPYSNFCVGACLVSIDRKFVTGTNFENAAYGSTLCAERAAVLRANTMGIRHFKSIVIIARGENFDTTEVTGPCGSCRQVLYEISQISNSDLQVVLSTTKKDKIVVTSIKELLPLGFVPSDLGIDIKKYQSMEE